MKDTEKISAFLAQNIEYLRGKKNFTQQQLAELAGIPRTTLTNIESGFGNPSLVNLLKVAAVLAVSVDELLSRPRTECQLIPAADVPVETRNDGTSRIFKLLPDPLKGIVIAHSRFSHFGLWQRVGGFISCNFPTFVGFSSRVLSVQSLCTSLIFHRTKKHRSLIFPVFRLIELRFL